MEPGPPLTVVSLAVLARPYDLTIGEQPVMLRKGNADEAGKAERATSMPMVRNPAAAVVEEYEAARRQGIREAYELFIARHGDDPLAEQARAALMGPGR
jgi:hypothetical protein